MSDETGSGTSAQQQLQASMLAALQDISASNESVLAENRITSEAIRDLADEAADRSRQRRNNRSSSANDSKGSQSKQSDFSKNLSKSISRYNKAAQSGQKFQEILYEKKMKTTSHCLSLPTCCPSPPRRASRSLAPVCLSAQRTSGTRSATRSSP